MLCCEKGERYIYIEKVFIVMKLYYMYFFIL